MTDGGAVRYFTTVGLKGQFMVHSGDVNSDLDGKLA